MASEFAESLIQKIDQGDGMLVALEQCEYEDLIDAELSEAREVLNLLRTASNCWCEQETRTRLGKHMEVCQRARRLYERLGVK